MPPHHRLCTCVACWQTYSCTTHNKHHVHHVLPEPGRHLRQPPDPWGRAPGTTNAPPRCTPLASDAINRIEAFLIGVMLACFGRAYQHVRARLRGGMIKPGVIWTTAASSTRLQIAVNSSCGPTTNPTTRPSRIQHSS